ncbi:MAG: class I SAM-dependent methyltransferase [Bdellovibrionota bacterium]
MSHENDSEDVNYRNFLKPVFDAVKERIATPASGLDFGCGDGPALYEMLNAGGYEMSLYDLYFRPDRSPLHKTYDFVTCTEVVEHFRAPRESFEELKSLVRPKGLLAIMTFIYPDDCDFENWHYRRDPTHVSFYSKKSFEWLAERVLGAKAEFISSRIVCLRF